jgi:peptidyl-dipeptidase A
MKRIGQYTVVSLLIAVAGCGPAVPLIDVLVSGPETADDRGGEEGDEMTRQTAMFLQQYQQRFEVLERQSAISYWRAANSGKKTDFDAYSEAELALKSFHSDKARFEKIEAFLKERDNLKPLDARSLEVARLAFKGNQLSAQTIEALVDAQAEIEHRFNTFRATLDGKEMSNNELLDALKEETDSARRKAIWEALKQVGQTVSDKLIALAVLRNRAANELGYGDYFEMQVRLQEHDPDELAAIFRDLEAITEAPFQEIKAALDEELAEKFHVPSGEIRPWHYDNPFFQAPPPSKAVDPDLFYRDKPKEQIMQQAATFYRDIGLPVDAVIARSDLYEREGKDQHAFCITIDRRQDVRTLLNIKPNAAWMDTALHEEGHAVYYINIDDTLPFNLREASHIFVTEGIAMLFGALAYNSTWLVEYGGADSAQVADLEDALIAQRRREQLIFARWAMVMFHFERAFYADPSADLDTLWWDLVERFQHIPRPADRHQPDWASKPHFTIAPVYYHNYLLGEVFAAQLRHVLAEIAGHEGPTASLSFNGQKRFGAYLKEKVFAPGMSKPWPAFVKDATGEPFSVKYFGQEISD